MYLRGIDLSMLDEDLAAASNCRSHTAEIEAVEKLKGYSFELVKSSLVRLLGSDQSSNVGNDLVKAATSVLAHFKERVLGPATSAALSSWDIEGFQENIENFGSSKIEPSEFAATHERDTSISRFRDLLEQNDGDVVKALAAFIVADSRRGSLLRIVKRNSTVASVISPFLSSPAPDLLLALNEEKRLQSLPALVYAAVNLPDDEGYFHRILHQVMRSCDDTKTGVSSLVRAMRCELELCGDDFPDSEASRFLRTAQEYSLTDFRDLGLRRLGRDNPTAAQNFLIEIGEGQLVKIVRSTLDGMVRRYHFRSSNAEDLEMVFTEYLDHGTDPERISNCMKALAQIRGPSVIPRLLEFVTGSSQLSEQALSTVVDFRAAAVEPLLRAAQRSPGNTNLLDSLARLDSARPIVVEMLTERSSKLAEEIVRRWSDGWTKALSIRRALNSPRADIRLAMVSATIDQPREVLPFLTSALIQTVDDDVDEVSIAAIARLEQLGATEALPSLVSRLGERRGSASGAEQLARAITRLSAGAPLQISTLLDEGSPQQKRGVLRFFTMCGNWQASTAAVRGALHDEDDWVKLDAISLLVSARDLGSCVHIMALIGDPSRRVADAAMSGLISLCMTSHPLFEGLLRYSEHESPDILNILGTTCNRWIRDGRVPQTSTSVRSSWEDAFLIGLGEAFSLESDPRPILSLLNESQVDADSPKEPSLARIALALGMLSADRFAAKGEIDSGIAIQHEAIRLAGLLKLPQIQWRGWQSVATQLERLGDDRAAWEALRNAMGVIDEMWFALLDPDQGRTFFKDKAALYDQAVHCCLRLRYDTQALETAEKAKTRYLGDLIARWQLEPRRALAPHARTFWMAVKEAREANLRPVTLVADSDSKMRITSVSWDTVPPAGNAWQPKHLAALRKHPDTSRSAKTGIHLIDKVWELVARLLTARIENREAIDFTLEDLYQLFLEWPGTRRRAGSSNDLRWFEDYRNAASRLGGESDLPLWIFAEYGSWIESLLRGHSSDDDWSAYFVSAILEGLSVYLKHEPVEVTPAEPSEGNQKLHFLVSASPKSLDKGESSRGTSGSLARRTGDREWDYVERVARGETTTYAALQDAILGKDFAVIQFHVTRSGTIAFVITGGDSSRLAPRSGRSPEIFTFPHLDIKTLGGMLLDADGWFSELRDWQHGEIDPQGEDTSNESILTKLYCDLFEPIDMRLRDLGVSKLLIVPHRGLQVVPFHSLYYEEKGERRYVQDDYEVTYAPSSTLAMISRERSGSGYVSKSLLCLEGDSTGLQATTYELEAISPHFASVERLHEGDTFEEPRVRSLYSHFHFTGHATYNYESPLESGLSLAWGSDLSLASLFDNQFGLPRVQLCCLSACETAMSDPSDVSDEYIGLTGGFLFAGATTVVSSLWKVPDIPTALLMHRFYSNLGSGDSVAPAEALRSAQIWLRNLNVRALHQFIREQADNFSKDTAKLIKKQYPVRQKGTRKPFSAPVFWAAFIASAGPHARSLAARRGDPPEELTTRIATEVGTTKNARPSATST